MLPTGSSLRTHGYNKHAFQAVASGCIWGIVGAGTVQDTSTLFVDQTVLRFGAVGSEIPP